MNESLDARAELLLGMTEGERKLLLIQEDGIAEKQHMNALIQEYRYFSDRIQLVKRMARQAVIDYNEDHDDDSLNAIEQWTEVLETFTEYRKKLRVDIRESRERVRWLRQQWKTTKQQLKS